MARPLKLVIVEDSAFDTELMLRELRQAGFAPEWKRVSTEAEYLAELAAEPEVVISDFAVPQLNGFRALELLRERDARTPFILVSGVIGEDTAVLAMKKGASDYLMKDRLARLGPAVTHVLEQSRLRRERREVEASMARTQAQLDLLEASVARLNDMVIITEAEPLAEPGPRIVFVNDAFVRRTGYAKAEALGRSPRFLQGPKTSRAELDRIQEAMARWQPVRVELLNYTKAGEEFWVELDMAPVADANGWFTHWVAVERDITKRKKMEEALRTSEERLRVVTDNAQLGLIIIDRERRYVFANSTYSGIVGVPVHEILGRSVAELLPTIYEDDIRPRLDRAFRGERVCFARSVGRDSDNTHYEIRYEPIRSEGAVSSVVVVIVDITERIRTERVRLEAEARYRTLFECAPDGILITDAQSNLIDANASVCRMLGYGRAELLGLNSAQIVDPAEVAHIEATVKEIQSGAEHHREWRFKRKDGSGFVAEVIGTMMPDGSVLGLIRDITDRKRAETAVRAAAEQLRTLAARVQSVREEERTTIAREIHDILAQDLTRLKIDLSWHAKQLARPEVPAERAAAAGRMAEAIAQVDTAISTVQRIATDLRPVVLDSLGLPAAVEWVVQDFAQRTGLACRVQVGNATTALDRDRATAIFRILQESLTNVARHARASEVEVEFSEESGLATLTICDNGVGIDHALLDDPRSIGLLGMRERAHAFGGAVEISGSPQSGTSVVVQLPINNPAAP
ncbi:MAG: PAS domain S-box protein [Opitutaceae bacterium]|nr:PAS domain S-box protein [Opitutaceae bacterium]